MITKRQFDILTYLEDTRKYVAQRELAKEINSSLGTVNKDIQDLNEMGYIEEGIITQKGIEALEPFKVERAIFIAAGFGSRMVPITLNTPKPLVRVKGMRIIDSLLDAVLEVGINEIYIVRGYLSEQFDQLLYKYPMIKFVENPSYCESNNISSAMCVNYLFRNAYVFDGDLLLNNKKLISKYQYSSNYLGIPTQRTDDWCFQTKNDKITGVSVGGVNCYRMIGISYWTKEDGMKFASHIKEVYYSPGGKERFWDQVVLEYHLDEYDVSLRKCSDEDIIEIDTFRELIALDKTYDISY